jgi:hypothetical protein
MVGFPHEDLVRLRAKLESEAKELESQVDVLVKRLDRCREQIQAINTLVQPEQTSETHTAQPLPTGGSRPTADSWGDFAPTDAYWVPILETLAERGGREHSNVVLDLVEKKMTSILKPEDYEILPSGVSVRWRNRAQWQRQNMVQQGLLSKNSPRGIWEITLAGRQWLHDRNKKAS